MNNISLMQISFFVAAVCLVSFFVNADDALTAYNMEETTEIYTEITNNPASVEVTQNSEDVEDTSDRFTFTSLDSDQNGKLSQQEVIAGKNDWLLRTFNEIDSNTDALITEQELVNFATFMASTITSTN